MIKLILNLTIFQRRTYVSVTSFQEREAPTKKQKKAPPPDLCDHICQAHIFEDEAGKATQSCKIVSRVEVNPAPEKTVAEVPQEPSGPSAFEVEAAEPEVEEDWEDPATFNDHETAMKMQWEEWGCLAACGVWASSKAGTFRAGSALPIFNGLGMLWRVARRQLARPVWAYQLCFKTVRTGASASDGEAAESGGDADQEQDEASASEDGGKHEDEEVEADLDSDPDDFSCFGHEPPPEDRDRVYELWGWKKDNAELRYLADPHF